MASPKHNILFGGKRGWNASDWTASDDRVRGGKSHSYLRVDDGAALFYGNLDIHTLGGAGFASQRTRTDDQHWDFSQSEAIELLIDVAKSDRKRYTLILKDEILPRNPENGREQSTTSWEYDFEAQDGSVSDCSPQYRSVVIPWNKFKPTYRGKEKDPGHALNLSDIRRLSLMMRSFFGDQEGDFTLCVVRIALRCTSPNSLSAKDDLEARNSLKSTSSYDLKEAKPTPSSIWTKLFSLCNKL